MPTFLDTTGQPTLGIAICSRCQFKRMLGELVDDGNIPGFKVCRKEISPGCWDNYDPMRGPARLPDRMTLPFSRPDVDIELTEAERVESGLPLTPPFP
jgi:hypothetical protein